MHMAWPRLAHLRCRGESVQLTDKGRGGGRAGAQCCPGAPGSGRTSIHLSAPSFAPALAGLCSTSRGACWTARRAPPLLPRPYSTAGGWASINRSAGDRREAQGETHGAERSAGLLQRQSRAEASVPSWRTYKPKAWSGVLWGHRAEGGPAPDHMSRSGGGSQTQNVCHPVPVAQKQHEVGGSATWAPGAATPHHREEAGWAVKATPRG